MEIVDIEGEGPYRSRHWDRLQRNQRRGHSMATPPHALTRRIERSLSFSTREGMAYGGMQGAGEQFIGAYAIALGATNPQLGLLTSLSTLCGALAQASSTRMALLLGSRKRLVLVSASLQSLL